MTNDATAILADTQAYGFRFAEEDVSKGRGNDKRVIGSGPILIITDPVTFEEHFPGRIAAMLDGSSARVVSQRVVRDTWDSWLATMPDERGPKPESEGLKVKVLSAVLGVKARTPSVVEVKVYMLPDGTETKDQQEALDAWKEANS